MTVEALLNNECLIQGPDFLTQPEEEWQQRPTDMGRFLPVILKHLQVKQASKPKITLAKPVKDSLHELI